MLEFSQLTKPIKWQDLLEKGKNGRNASRTGAKIHFSEKNILGLGALYEKRPLLAGKMAVCTLNNNS